jgi:cbb3-type cytochrome oxidase maturation protein
MEVIYGLIPFMILLGLVAVGVFFWAARSGQFDDLQGEAHRILMDDDLDDVELQPQDTDEQSSAEDSATEPQATDRQPD